MQALAAAALLAAGLALAGCAAPENLVRKVDEGQADLSRRIAGVVDGVDRVFGEPRVEDRERIVRAKVGGSLELRENSDASVTVPLALRVPLPALERRSNIFLQFESTADASADLEQAQTTLDESKSFSATILTRRSPRLETGARLELYWDDGPQTGVRPFLRLERPLDPSHRIFFEQQVYYRTDVRAGARGLFGVDRILGERSFARFTTSVEGNRGNSGASIEHTLGYRQPVSLGNAALAAEIGTAYDTFAGDPETEERGGENDDDEAYARVRLIGRALRPWLEYEITPALHFPWRHDDKAEFSAAFTLRVVFERNLPGPPRSAAPAEPEEPEGSAEPAEPPAP